MFDVALASETDFDGWRACVRRLRLGGVSPQDAHWRVGEGERPLFAEPLPSVDEAAPFTAPRTFIDLARDVLLHRSERRLPLLYRLLWRLKDEPRLMEIASDPDVRAAEEMRKSVAQAIHKMHAFVRFRLVEGEAEETYIAWFEPPHRVALAASDRFTRRMGRIRFSILTPDIAVHWDGNGALSTSPPIAKEAAPDEDGLEAFWRTYYASVFNPARLNTKVMSQHMAKKYWKNLPEAGLIPELTQAAGVGIETMVHAAPTQPSLRALKIAARRARDEPIDSGIAPDSLEAVAAGVHVCRRCDLWRDATQGVPGEGPGRAKLMFVGEQPGDQEDLSGHPFVGPAGQLLDKALAAAGVPRSEAYVTNAVKHFKHELRGKRRLHKTPDAGEVQACKWWLDNERRLVRPKLIVALGATAARAVLGRPVAVMKERGPVGALENGAQGFVTVHPSMLLRIPDAAGKAAAWKDFVGDLSAAWKLVA